MSRRSLASPREVSEFLQIPERTLTEWRYRRTGPPYARIGRHVRYDWDQLEKWLAAQAQESAA